MRFPSCPLSARPCRSIPGRFLGVFSNFQLTPTSFPAIESPVMGLRSCRPCRVASRRVASGQSLSNRRRRGLILFRRNWVEKETVRKLFVRHRSHNQDFREKTLFVVCRVQASIRATASAHKSHINGPNDEAVGHGSDGLVILLASLPCL